MESSFKKGYEKTVNSDGSYNISLKGQRRGAGKTSGYPVLYIIVFLVCAFFTNSIAGKIAPNSVPVFLASWAIFSSVLWFIFYFVFKSLNLKNTSILVIPNDGLQFDGQQLPFKDIQTLGVSYQTTRSNIEGNAQVYANSHGNEIKLTGWVKISIAEAVADELKQSSGKDWN